MKNVSNKGSKGITLIALVVTIIVLLILAGISLAMLTGPNGIISRATSANESTEVAQIRERIRLAVSTAAMKGKGEITYNNLESQMKQEFGKGNYEIRETENTMEWKVIAFTNQNKEVFEIVMTTGIKPEKIIKIISNNIALTESGKIVTISRNQEQWGEIFNEEELDYINGVKKSVGMVDDWSPARFCILDNSNNIYVWYERWGENTRFRPMKVDELNNIVDIDILYHGTIIAKNEMGKIYIITNGSKDENEYRYEYEIIEIEELEGVENICFEGDPDKGFCGYVTTRQGKLYYITSNSPEGDYYLEEIEECNNVEIAYGDISIYDNSYLTIKQSNGDIAFLETQIVEGRLTHSITEEIEGVDNITDIYSVGSGLIVKTEDGDLFAWGYNVDGNLGLGDVIEQQTLRKIDGVNNVDDVYYFDGAVFAKTKEGDIYAWGHNYDKCLGLGNINEQTTPRKIECLSGVNELYQCWCQIYAVTNSGNLFVWGETARYGFEGVSEYEPTCINEIESSIFYESDIIKVEWQCDGGAQYIFTSDGKVYKACFEIET